MRRLSCRLLILLLALLIPGMGLAKGKSGSGGTVPVKGYYRKDGTYVQPHTRRAPGSGSDTAPDTAPDDQTPKPKATERTLPKTGKTVKGKVARVVGGDALDLLVDTTQYRIRLEGIDAPESGQPFDVRSKKALSDKVAGKTVKLLSQGQDENGRTLGIIYADGCVNTAMVREGWAWYDKQSADSKALAAAEEEARKAKVGLWAEQPTPPTAGETLEGKVVRVADGNTLVLLVDKARYSVRLLGIDAPEIGQPFGKRSKKALSEKVSGKTVKVLSQGQDENGRILGIVRVDGCVNTAMVREGWAWHDKKSSDSETLAAAEEEAQAAKVGLWTASHPIAPWDWRKSEQGKSTAGKPDPFADPEPSGKSAEAKPPEDKQEQPAEKKYWLTTKTYNRHNESCRYYKNSAGRPCGPDEGTPCKICGG